MDEVKHEPITQCCVCWHKGELFYDCMPFGGDEWCLSPEDVFGVCDPTTANPPASAQPQTVSRGCTQTNEFLWNPAVIEF